MQVEREKERDSVVEKDKQQLRGRECKYEDNASAERESTIVGVKA